MTVYRAIGLMSGTSLDGVDVALVETDGEAIVSLGPSLTRPYSVPERALLKNALSEGARLHERSARPGILADAEYLITRAHAEAVEEFVRFHNIDLQSIDIIGFHGQTVLHRPERGLSIQIGDGLALSQRLGRPVAHDFRAADIAAGGQGAPLVPVFHQALMHMKGFKPPLAVLNIGGVANVTFLNRDGTMLAFDTGPGNALIDDLVHDQTGQPFDEEGKIAARGKPDEALLAWVLTHPFFSRKPPKSLDRNWFSKNLVAHSSLEDGAATLAHFTARAIHRSLDWISEPPTRWIVAGGGALNHELMRLLRLLLQVPVISADEAGWSVQGLEAQAFAYLAVRSLMGKPLTFPGTTGVGAPMTGGVIV